MEKRYQVFVSSTYADLQEVRKTVIQTLMEMDCIPAGMELFPAADEDQFEFIKRVIDDCDYYLVIVGGRYGSTTPEGISYTEKEYDYAVERNLKVIALLHEKPEELAVKDSDIDPELRIRLEAFREKLKTNRLVKFWSKAEDLPGLVSLSLSKTIKMYPAVGWMRANKATNEDLFAEINQLRKENESLKEKIANIPVVSEVKVPDLADFESSFSVSGVYWKDHGGKRSWEISATWQEIFSYIAPYLWKYPSDEFVKSKLTQSLVDRLNVGGTTHAINDQDFETIKVQLKAYGLITLNYSKTVQGGMALFWHLTPEGDRRLMELRTVKGV